MRSSLKIQLLLSSQISINSSNVVDAATKLDNLTSNPALVTNNLDVKLAVNIMEKIIGSNHSLNQVFSVFILNSWKFRHILLLSPKELQSLRSCIILNFMFHGYSAFCTSLLMNNVCF